MVLAGLCTRDLQILAGCCEALPAGSQSDTVFIITKSADISDGVYGLHRPVKGIDFYLSSIYFTFQQGVGIPIYIGNLSAKVPALPFTFFKGRPGGLYAASPRRRILLQPILYLSK